MSSGVIPHTPVLVGIGVAQRREEDWTQAIEPIDLMTEAVWSAGEDCGRTDLLARADLISVPRGRWSYANPGGAIARAIGADGASSLLSTVGVLQQTLIGDACDRIAQGLIQCAIVVGGDAGYRLLRARIAGTCALERETQDEPDEFMAPADELRHPAERAAGLVMPVGLYALIESASRAQAGLSFDEHRTMLARQLERFSQIAADNPHAWSRSVRSAKELGAMSERNAMQAFPYTKAHCSSWNVDQAAALLLCSSRLADELGIATEKRVYPVAAAESNHMVPVVARANLTECVGAQVTGSAVLEASGQSLDDIDLVELYSCFPIAVKTFAKAIDLPPGRDCTITGGMNFAGGPYNNYFLQATARAAELIRAGRGRTALLSCVSGIITKQAFALWSREPGDRPFVRLDLSNEVAQRQATVDVLQDYCGEGEVVACTVLHSPQGPPRAIALIETPSSQRAVATSADERLVEGIEQEEWVGKRVRVAAGEFTA